MVSRPLARGLSLVALLCPAVTLLSSAVAADAPHAKGEAPPAAEEKGRRYDPDNTRAISQYMEKVVAATAKLKEKDVAGAIEGYKQAIPLAPRNPYGYYLIGEAQLLGGNLAEADSALRSAEEFSNERNPSLRARVLFAVADLRERQKNWEEAAKTWRAYADLAQKHEDAGGVYPQTAASRIQAIDEVLKLEKTTEGVRQRIQAEREGGAAPPPPPDAGAKK